MRFGIVWFLLVASAETLVFRCGSHLLREGDHQLKVQEQCGRPDESESRPEKVLVTRQIHPSFRFREWSTRGVMVRRCPYSRGSEKFIRELVLETGCCNASIKRGAVFSGVRAAL